MKRDVLMDYAKAIGILLVVLGHSSVPKFGAEITFFHIPLFFLISGILCNNSKTFDTSTSIWSFLQRKSKSLLLPYFIWGLLDLVIYSLVSGELFGGKAGFISQIVYFVTGRRNIDNYYFTGTLWFLTALFSCELLYYILKKISKSKWIAEVVFFVLLLVIAKLLKNNTTTLPFNIDTIPYTMPFFFVGIWISELKDCLRDKYKIYIRIGRYILFVIATIVFIVIVEEQGRVNVYSHSYCSLIYYYIGATAGCISTLLLLTILKPFMEKNIIGKALVFLGLNSLEIMAIHQQWVIHPINCMNIKPENSWINFGMRFGGSICISLFVIMIYSYIKSFIGAKYERKNKETAI